MPNKSMNEKLTEGRQYRTVVEIRALPEEQTDKKIVEGYATTFNEPYELWRYGGYVFMEQVDAHAFDEADMSDTIMQYDHEGRVFARISNQTLELTVDDHGLKIRADLSGTEIGRQLYEEIKGGYTNKMSFGFTVKEDSEQYTENQETGITTVLRTITRIGKLYDVSAVSIPANNATEISARSWCDGVISQLTEERRKAEARERQKKKIKILSEV